MIYGSLTDVPTDLKECIDWLIAAKGSDDGNGFKAMAFEVYRFLATQRVGLKRPIALERIKDVSKKFIGQEVLKKRTYADMLLKRYKTPIDREVGKFRKMLNGMKESDFENVIRAKGVTAETFAEKLGKVVDGCETFLESIKTADEYESSYHPDVTWDRSCGKNPEACAMVLVGVAPMLYVGLHSLMDASAPGVLGLKKSNDDKNLEKVLFALGYVEPLCRPNLGCSDIRKALKGVNSTVLSTIYDLAGFWAFY
ncbi:hypothetical protein, conserved [Babesia ovata]|uniref:Uncharacterized protein n=1 Tax=Babesia ovata TaxID=189622 RepID=A0A2H6KBK4_9APIC|nr:uncharacterized protein BOVATA_018640 [Babesia ovata]GBE60371.1 hypothetical protein, conserved [Babesia ovata]